MQLVMMLYTASTWVLPVLLAVTLHEAAILETATFQRLLLEAWDMGFRGAVCLQHYNEPLQDARIAGLGTLVKETGFPYVFICTNADLMDELRAAGLDGVFDEMLVALYMNEPVKSWREAWLRTLFKSTKLTFTGGSHIATHYSPAFPVEWMIKRHANNPCSEPLRRFIINHRGDMLMCCDDMTGNFNLGNVHEQSLEELWYSDRHQDMVLALQKRGGRFVHPHCQSCPRP